MIIAIAGKKRSGKSTIGDFLVQNRGYIPYSFALPLKLGVKEMFGFSDEQVFGSLKDVVDLYWGITPREILKIIGTDLLQFDIHNYTDKLKHIGRKIWVKRFELWYNKENPSNVVIPDVRFFHEIDIIKKYKGEIWRVKRPNLTSIDNHSSENEIDIAKYDLTLINDETKEDLYSKIDRYLK